MVQYERFDIGTQAVIYVHSDAGMKIREGDGDSVEDAVFILPDYHTYEETDEYTDAQRNAENYAAIGEMIFGGLSDVDRAQDLKEVMRDAAQLLPDETALTAKEALSLLGRTCKQRPADKSELQVHFQRETLQNAAGPYLPEELDSRARDRIALRPDRRDPLWIRGRCYSLYREHGSGAR